MRQLSLFTALQSSTEGIDTEFRSAHGGMSGSSGASYATMANTKGGSKALRSIEKALFSGLARAGSNGAAFNHAHHICL